MLRNTRILFRGEESALKNSQVKGFPVAADKKAKKEIAKW